MHIAVEVIFQYLCVYAEEWQQTSDVEWKLIGIGIFRGQYGAIFSAKNS